MHVLISINFQQSPLGLSCFTSGRIFQEVRRPFVPYSHRSPEPARRVSLIHDDEPEVVSERLLRELIAEPKPAAEKLYAVWTCWTRAGKEQSLRALAVMLREALKLPELSPLARGYATVCLGWIMQARLSQAEIEA